MKGESLEYSIDDLQMLIALQEDPLQSYSNLSGKLDKSVKTVSRWINRLEENNLFHPVRAILNHALLGIEVIDVVVEVKDLVHVELIERFCNDHPYTGFRCRINGSINGLYMQYLAPNGSKKHYEEIFSILKEKKIITDVKFIQNTERMITTTFNLEYWDNSKYEWKFDWKDWLTTINSNELVKATKNTITPFKKSIFEQLDIVDMCILRLLNVNAKMKLKDIQKRIFEYIQIQESIQRISERIKYLKQHFIHNYRLNLNAGILNIYSTLFILVECDESFTNKIKNLLVSNPPPFPGYFKVTTEGFMWFISMSASDFSEVSTLLWNAEIKSYRVNFVDHKSTEQYAFWEQNFNNESKTWKISKEYMVDIPLKNLGII